MLPDELQKLYDLYEQGAISEAEYSEIKQRLMKHDVAQKPDGLLGFDVKGYKALLHASQYIGHVAPIVGLVVPIILWSHARHLHPEVDTEGKHVMNWIISEIVYIVMFLLLGFGVLIFGVVAAAAFKRALGPLASLAVMSGYGIIYAGIGLIALAGTIFPLIGVLRVMDGKSFKYPLAIRFLK
ncbi:DUF4870 domain-containing protein [filamentous cyanobacterium LEGE 11480]|uniref:DUF4870 domain-containing protein n=1 Tax=Romeriopsis navalis LEGE 11480 TaxID=2777977 RepID=A0A928Z764_9CYAN|nr:DUF4870 domain-containing protein [Romeriopsis navalis]MBE9033378.1 DUF4870 domain-containing protein [Romeriopsis navalis LEGE 11480]